MIRSMTGYGRREAPWAGGTVAVELRSVNHRFCEVIVRLPRGLVSVEEELRRAVQQRCARGRIEVTVSLSGGKDAGKSLTLDRALAAQYHRILRELQREFRLGGTIDLALLAGFRDIVGVTEVPLNERRLTQTVKRLLRAALTDLDAMRRREGGALKQDVQQRLQTVREIISRIKARTPLVIQSHFERMKARIEKLIGSAELDHGRLYQELALYADRCDVTEELTRLESHLTQFETTLKGGGAIGKTLDFLLQEMGREVNTVGSKANDAEISTCVVQMKGELEKIREQVQNVE